jgi:hypothetical protein
MATSTITNLAQVTELSDKNPAGVRLGQSATDLVGFYGKAPCDQPAVISLATSATHGTTRTAVQAILTALKEMGLIASA